MDLKNLKSPPPNPEPWIVWDLERPMRYCTVVSRTWIKACTDGMVRLHCERVDAILESDEPLERFFSRGVCYVATWY
jgi:hypothetical protein